jgi:hypothetical protein
VSQDCSCRGGKSLRQRQRRQTAIVQVPAANTPTRGPASTDLKECLPYPPPPAKRAIPCCPLRGPASAPVFHVHRSLRLYGPAPSALSRLFRSDTSSSDALLPSSLGQLALTAFESPVLYPLCDIRPRRQSDSSSKQPEAQYESVFVLILCLKFACSPGSHDSALAELEDDGR